MNLVRRTILTIILYFLPTAVLSSVGILILIFQRAGFDIVFGILVLILAVVILTGGLILQGVLRAQARRARLQTDFVAKVSHELRTPLSSIRMFVDTLKKGVHDEEEEKVCLDVISTETSRLTSMIERLLTWGRMEAGRRKYGMRPELASTLVGEALAQLEPQLKASQVELVFDLPEKSPVVLVDRQAMVEALLNLLTNALKYGAPDGHGVLTIRVYDSGRRALIEICDQGPGIPRQEQRHVFEKFYRGSSQLVAQTKGSGLGLAMVRLIVRAHKGKIKLSSQPGEGARFIVDLPLLDDDNGTMEIEPG